MTYNGPFDQVEVDLPDGGTALCERGKSVALPADVAKSICEQPDWTKAKAEKE